MEPEVGLVRSCFQPYFYEPFVINSIMAEGVNSKHPLQARFQALREKYPQYHVVISCCEGSFEFLPGARWVYHESEAKAGGNFIMNFTKGAPRYEYHIIVEGTFKYTRKNMTQNK